MLLLLWASAGRTARVPAEELRAIDCVWVRARVLNVSYSHCTHNRSADFRISADIQRLGCYECSAVSYVLRRLRTHNAALLDLGAKSPCESN